MMTDMRVIDLPGQYASVGGVQSRRHDSLKHVWQRTAPTPPPMVDFVPVRSHIRNHEHAVPAMSPRERRLEAQRLKIVGAAGSAFIISCVVTAIAFVCGFSPDLADKARSAGTLGLLVLSFSGYIAATASKRDAD